MNVQYSVLALFVSASASAAPAVQCPSGTFTQVRCTTSTFAAAYCTTDHAGSAIVVSNSSQILRAELAPRRGRLNVKKARLPNRDEIQLRHYDLTGPGEISIATETKSAYCEVAQSNRPPTETKIP